MWTEAAPEDVAEYISLLSDDAAVQMQTVDKYIDAVKAKQEKADPIEALEMNDEVAFWEGVRSILAERNGVTAENTPVAENEMQPVEGVNTSIAEATADAQAFMAAAQADTVDAYQKYLDDYPNGAYRDGARAGVWKIEGINPESYNDLENARSAAAKVLQDNIAQPVNGDVVAPVADEDVNAVGNADTAVDNQGNPIDANGKLIVDGVTSIDEITDEDFENPTRNVQLPALPENVANAIGTEGRPVVIKKNVFEKNNKTHVELEPENSRDILRSALYNPDIVGSTQPIKRPDYKVAIRTGEKNAIVVLDVYRGKEYVEIVGWRMINEKGLAKMQRQAEREGGQFLILSPNEGSAAALSALPLGQSSVGEDTAPVTNKQEIAQESGENAENGGEISSTPSLLDVVKTLYAKGREVASKLFGMKFFDVAKTPKFMKELGLRGDKFTIRYGVIARHYGKDSEHKLPQEIWEQLPQTILHPFAITKYYEDENKQKQKGYRLYTALQFTNGSYIVVSAEVKNAGRDIEVNAINTIFGRSTLSEVHDELIYTSETITPEQQSLLNGNNPHQYTAEQELSKDKGTIISPITNELGEKDDVSTIQEQVQAAEEQSASAEETAKEHLFNLADWYEGDVVRDYHTKKLYRVKKHSRNGVTTIAELDAEGNEVGTTTLNAHNNRRYEIVDANHTPTISQDTDQVSEVEDKANDFDFNAVEELNDAPHTVRSGINTYATLAYYNAVAKMPKNFFAEREEDIPRMTYDMFEAEFKAVAPHIFKRAQSYLPAVYEYMAARLETLHEEHIDSLNKKQTTPQYTIAPAQYTTKKGKVLDMHLVKFTGELTKAVAEGGNAPGQNAAPEKKGRKSPTTPQELAQEALAQAEENRRKPLRARAQEWQQKLGVQVNVIESVDEVKNSAALQAINEGARVAGWFSGGKVYVYMPGIEDMADLDKTVVHEVVAHKGLKSLMGDKFDALCDKVWEAMGKEAREKFLRYVNAKDIDAPSVAEMRAAADEYMAYIAEGVDLTDADRTVWQKVVEFFREFIVSLGVKMSDAEIETLIKASYANLRSNANVNGKTEAAELTGNDFRARVDNDGTRFSKKGGKNKKSPNTATQNKSVKATAVSSDLFAKIDKLKEIYNRRDSKRTRGFITDIARELDLTKDGSSHYRAFSTPLGDITLRVSNHNSKLKEFEERHEDEGVSIVISRKKNKKIDRKDSTGKSHIDEFFYPKQSLERSQGRPLVQILESIEEFLTTGVYVDKSGIAQPEDSNGIRFRKDDATLIGTHSITEDKLRSAIKMGGLANPSAAIFEMGEEMPGDYGEITFVMPSSMVDKKTGRNTGAYAGDAWTPTYPQVERQMGKRGSTRAYEDVRSVPKEMQKEVRMGLDSWLDGKEGAGLVYLFLQEEGMAPELSRVAQEYPDEVRNRVSEIAQGEPFYRLSSEQKQQIVDLFIEQYYSGDRAYYSGYLNEKVAMMQEKLADNNIKSFIKKSIQQYIDGVNEYGYDYEAVSDFLNKVQRDIEHSGGVNDRATTQEAARIIREKGLEKEFKKWKEDLVDRYEIKEVIFKGFTPTGNRRYVPHTLENVSKEMKEQGRNGAVGLNATFNKFAAGLLKPLGSLDAIRKRKGNLRATHAETEAFRDKWSEVYYDLAEKLQPDAKGYEDYGLDRVAEAAKKKDPKAFIESEYGIELSEADEKALKDMVWAIQNEYPVMYFETKFERPVYLDEFAGVAVPENVGDDIVEALNNAGVRIETYEPGNEKARMEAVRRLSEDEGIRFRIANRNQEIFVSNARKAVEEIKQEKATPQQWLAMLKKSGGLKAGEDAWMGLSEWLENSEAKSLTKQELLDFINENAIEIEEVGYIDKADIDKEYYVDPEGGDFEFTSEGWDEVLERYGTMDIDYVPNEYFEFVGTDEERLSNAIEANRKAGLINERGYDLEDAEDAELFISEVEVAIREDIDNWSFNADGNTDVNTINSTRLDYTTEGLENKREIALVVPTVEPYNQRDEVHFGDAGGGRAVAWVRFGETTDSEGNRVLVIDEIQSKRHQDGREKGYTSSRTQELQKERNALYEKMYSDGLSVEEHNRYVELGELLADASLGGVPAAPFEKNWQELAMKRMLRLAAEEGFDKVAWTTGEQQAQRYDMTRQVESIDVEENTVEEFSDGTPVAKNITISTANGMDIRIDTDADGVIHGGEYGGRNIADIVGKELAVKIMQPGNFKLEGEGLRIGGEGMKGFYDKMLPSFVSKYTKKWGAKVGEVTMPNLEQNNTMWSVDITPEMQESVMEGQTMFRKESERRQEKKRVNDAIDSAAGFLLLGGKKQAKKLRLEMEAKRKMLAKEIYSSVLKGDFNPVTLELIDKYIEDATPYNQFGKRISQRLPQRMERGLQQGARTNAVDALFSRICESAVPANERFSEAGRRKIEERKKELLKGWAIASGKWYTDLGEFTDDTEPIGEGKDSRVYMSKDGNSVIKFSKGKPFGKKFGPDIDNIQIFNDVFDNTDYEILGYGEIDGEFVRILKQDFVDFAESSPLTVEERVEYMRMLGFEPLNKDYTAFSNGEVVIADLQKSNILKDAAGNIRVIDADAKLHTKDVGGDYTYPPVETDLPEGTDIGSMTVQEDSATRLRYEPSKHNLEVAGRLIEAMDRIKAITGAKGYGSNSAYIEGETEDGEKWVIRVADHPANMSNFEDKNEDAEYILSIVIDEEFDEKEAAKHHEKITDDENVWQVVVNPLDIDYDALTRGVERFKRTGEGQYVYGNVNDVMFRIGGSEHSIKKSELRREVQRVDADIASAVNDTAAGLNTGVEIVSDIAEVPDARRRGSKGWYENGKVYLVLPNAEGVEDAVETVHKAQNEMWEAIRKATGQILAKQYESNMMSAEVKDEIEGMYRYYIPLRGFDENTVEDVYEYMNSSRSPLARNVTAKGRKSKAMIKTTFSLLF